MWIAEGQYFTVQNDLRSRSLLPREGAGTQKARHNMHNYSKHLSICLSR